MSGFYTPTYTGVDLSKILGGQTKILGRQKVVKSDKCMDVSQLLGARARAVPSQSLRLCLHNVIQFSFQLMFHSN